MSEVPLYGATLACGKIGAGHKHIHSDVDGRLICTGDPAINLMTPSPDSVEQS